MGSKYIRIKILVFSLLIILCAQLFSVALHVNSFEKLYTNSLISFYSVIGRDFGKNVNQSLRFGKPIKKLWGIDKQMVDIRDRNPELAMIVVSNPDGNILYSLDPELVGETLPQELAGPEIVEILSNKKQHIVLHDDIYHILLPAQDRKKSIVGILDVAFPEASIQKRVKRMVAWNFKALVVYTCVATTLLMMLLYSFVDFQKDKNTVQKRISVILLIVIGGFLAVASVLSAQYFRNLYLEVTYDKIYTLSDILRDDIDRLLSKGVKIDRLIKIEAALTEIVQETPEVEDIGIVHNDGTLLYYVNREGVNENSKQGAAAYANNLERSGKFAMETTLSDKNSTQGILHVDLNKEYIEGKTLEMLLDSLTVLVISMVFLLELMLLLHLMIVREKDEATEELPIINNEEEDNTETASLIRTAAFLYLSAASLTMSFLPLHMGELLEKFGSSVLPFSNKIMVGIPISVEMLCAAIAIILGGRITDKKGWKFVFVLGIFLSIPAAFLSGLVSNPLWFICCRGLMGMGYGVTWMAFQCYIFGSLGMDKQARGLAIMTAGIFAGTICGSAVGAMIAERLGYANVFYLSAASFLLPLAYVLFVSQKIVVKKIKDQKDIITEKVSFKELCSFVFGRNIFSLLFFASIPGALCFVGFVYYAVPIYLNDIGCTQSNIGRVIMLYGIFMIFLAPKINKFADQAYSKRYFIAVGGLFGGLGLISFQVLQGFWAAVLAMTMLGISASIGLASQTVFAMETAVKKQVGRGSAMGAYRFLQRIGQVLGPLVLGLLFTRIGIERGMFWIGVTYMMMIMFFVLISKENTVPPVVVQSSSKK